ncbi:uncharacterized protein [Manis javanica]|uniref:uncharacterized protein n=1 Tax=Manis javanica TaxID=9974 RepID=UPI003C6DB6A2
MMSRGVADEDPDGHCLIWGSGPNAPRFTALFCSPVPKALHLEVSLALERSWCWAAGLWVYHLLRRRRLRILCPSGGPAPSWARFPSRPARGARPRRTAPPVRAVRRPPHHPQVGLASAATPLLHPRAHPTLLLHSRTHAPLLLHAELQPAELLRAPAENPDPLRLLLRQRGAESATLLLRFPRSAPRRYCPAHSLAPQRPRGPAPPDGAALEARSHRPTPGSFLPAPQGKGLRGRVPSRSAIAPKSRARLSASPPGVDARPPGAAPCAGPRR